MKTFIPIEDEIGNGPMPMPVKWYLLIRDAEDFRKQTGMGLANVWASIHQGRYEEARLRMDQILRRSGEVR